MFRFPSGTSPFQILFGFALVLLSSTAVVVVGGTAQEPETVGTTQDDAVSAEAAASGAQPIAFSHAKHVGELEFDCQLCHAYARRGPVAGVPSVARCIGCHRFVQPDRPEIQKVLQYWENVQPIPWVRVHNLPDHVRFTHKRHVQADVACQACHGDVGQMDVAEQVQPLTMGWCLSCHEERQASTDCLACHW